MKFTPTTSTAASLGSAFGTGLSQPIDEAFKLLTQKKLMQIQSEHTAREAQKQKQQLLQANTPVFGKEVSEWLSQQDPQVQKTILQNPAALFQIQDLLTQSKASSTPMTNEMFGQPGTQQQMSMQGQQGAPQVSQLLGQEQGGKPQNVDMFKQAQQQPQQQLGQNLEAQRRNALIDAMTSPEEKRRQSKEKRDIDKLSMLGEKQQFAEKKFGYEQTKKYREEVEKMGEEADHTLALLGRQKELNKKGNLPHPAQTQFLRNFGMEWALNPDAQEFGGLEKEFLKGARSIFGGRVTNFEMSQFLRGIPTLMQSKEGRGRIIKNLDIMARLKKLKSETTNKILKNHEYPPANLQELVSDKMKNKREQLLNDFVTGGDTLKMMPSPEGNENKLLKTPEGTWKISNGKKWNDISQEEVDKIMGSQ